MKVLALLFALTIAGKIRHSDSQHIIRQLIQLKKIDVGQQLMFNLFILPAVPPQFYDLNEDYESRMLRWRCLKRVPQREDGCQESTEVQKCYMPGAEIMRKRMPENVKWLPELMTKALTTLQDFVCNSEDFGEALVLESAKIGQCQYDTIKHMVRISEETDIWWRKFWGSTQPSYKKNLEVFKATPTKANLCNFMEAMVDMKSVEKLCNSTEPFEAVNKYFAASFKTLCA